MQGDIFKAKYKNYTFQGLSSQYKIFLTNYYLKSEIPLYLLINGHVIFAATLNNESKILKKINTVISIMNNFITMYFTFALKYAIS